MYRQIYTKAYGLQFSQGTKFHHGNAEQVFKEYGLVKYKNVTLDHHDVPTTLKTGKEKTYYWSNKVCTMKRPYFDHPVLFKNAEGKMFLVCHSYLDGTQIEEVRKWATEHGLKFNIIRNWYGFNTTAFILHSPDFQPKSGS